MKDNHLAQAWLVIALAVLFGGALAAVEVGLKPRIDENRLHETIGQIPALVPGAAGGVAETLGERRVFRAVDERDRTRGWVIPAGGQGFADRIELLLALDPEGATITGLYVLDQKETPGLGNKIVDADWRNQFVGLSTERNLVVTKTAPEQDNEIHGVTGATISSESVADIVNRTAARVRPLLRMQDAP